MNATQNSSLASNMIKATQTGNRSQATGNRSHDHPRRHGLIRSFVYQDEASGDPVFAVAVEEQRLRRADLDTGDIVHGQLVDVLDTAERIDVELVLDLF